MIGTAKYYLGAVSYIDSTLIYGSTEKIYGEERGNTICGGCNNNSQKLIWEGNVGLMYPSDMYMVYKGVDNTCYTNTYQCKTNGDPVGVPSTGWIYNTNTLSGSITTWLLASSEDLSQVLRVHSDGYLYANVSSNIPGVRPVVYLKSSVKIKSGTGEVGNPYVLE